MFTVKQPVLDYFLYNDLSFLTIQGMDVIKPLFDGIKNMEIAYDYRRSKEEIDEIIKFSEKLQKQLIELKPNKQLKTNLDYKRSCLYENNTYPMPEMKTIQNISDLPALNQIMNNHFKFYIRPELEKDIKFFDVDCNFMPLLIRSDGLSLVEIKSLRTDEMIIEPPNHGISGIQLESFPFESSERLTPYIPICLADLNKYHIYDTTGNIYTRHNIEEADEWNWRDTLDYNSVRDELKYNFDLHEQLKYVNSNLRIFIEGDATY